MATYKVEYTRMLDDRQISTILAALQLWKRARLQLLDYIDEGEMAIATKHGELAALDAYEIVALYNTLKCGA